MVLLYICAAVLALHVFIFMFVTCMQFCVACDVVSWLLACVLCQTCLYRERPG